MLSQAAHLCATGEYICVIAESYDEVRAIAAKTGITARHVNCSGGMAFDGQ